MKHKSEDTEHSEEEEHTASSLFRQCIDHVKHKQKLQESEPKQLKDLASQELRSVVDNGQWKLFPLPDRYPPPKYLRKIIELGDATTTLVREQEKNTQLEKEIRGLQAYISELEATVKKSIVTGTKAVVDSEQVDHIVHVLSDELTKLELENKSMKETLEALEHLKNHGSNRLADVTTENMSGVENEADRTVHVSSDGWIRVGLKNDYCGEGKVGKASCQESVDSQESTKMKLDSPKYLSSMRNDTRDETDKPNNDSFGETTSFSTTVNITPPEVESGVEKESSNTLIDNQIMDSARNLTDKPSSGKTADDFKETMNNDFSDSNVSCNSVSKVTKIPEAFKHCAEDYLKNSSHCEEEIFWRKRSLISGFSHAVTPLNVILGQTVTENTTFNVQVKTLAGFQSFSIEFTNNHSRIVLQMKASVYPEYAFIFNSLDENWGPEERHQFLLEPNNVYDLCFVVKRHHFEFKISEPLLNPAGTSITYRHRMAPSEIRYIHISGDITVNEASVHEPENACCQEMRERLGSAFSEYVDLSYRYAVVKTKLKKALGEI